MLFCASGTDLEVIESRENLKGSESMLKRHGLLADGS